MSGKKSILDDFFGPTGECIECGKPFEEQRRDGLCIDCKAQVQAEIDAGREAEQARKENKDGRSHQQAHGEYADNPQD